MKVLILDDMKIRHENLQNVIGAEHSFTNCYTFTSAAAAIRKESFDLICIDHDLDDEMPGEVMDQGMYGTMYFTGADFADCLKNLWMDKDGRRPKVWVHSWNPQGAQVIRRVLENDFHVVVHPEGSWDPKFLISNIEKELAEEEGID